MTWEYTIYRLLNVKDEWLAVLNKYGLDGWELVNLVPNGPHTNLIFKRPVKADQKKAA